MLLDDFLGEHILTGCENGYLKIKNGKLDSANTLDIVLDGRTFSIIENEVDDYRSVMDNIIENRPDLVIKNIFEPCYVIAKFREMDNGVLDFYDKTTNEIVLSFGTLKDWDLYPMCILDFFPENMAINKISK